MQENQHSRMDEQDNQPEADCGECNFDWYRACMLRCYDHYIMLLAGEVAPLMVVWSVTSASTKQAIPWLLSVATYSAGLACTRHPTFCPYRILHVLAAVTGLTVNVHCN